MEVENYPKWQETNIGGTYVPLPWLWQEGYFIINILLILQIQESTIRTQKIRERPSLIPVAKSIQINLQGFCSA